MNDEMEEIEFDPSKSVFKRGELSPLDFLVGKVKDEAESLVSEMVAGGKAGTVRAMPLGNVATGDHVDNRVNLLLDAAGVVVEAFWG